MLAYGMEEESLAELKQIVHIHAIVVASTAEIQKMKLANDDARSESREDPFTAADFERVETTLKNHAEALGE